MANNSNQKLDEYLGSPKALHLEMPLYHKVDLTAEKTVGDEKYTGKEVVYAYLRYSSAIDAYCVYCKKESVFYMSEISGYKDIESWDNWASYEEVSLKCSRNANHKYTVFYLKLRNLFQKIGQFPSTADFQIPQVENYRKVLSDGDYQEFTKGIGLAAHGVGIGSFVYLRRVFENLIEEAHSKARNEQGFSEDEYLQARMDEKINLLKDYLPDFLVENKGLYSILSKGIHKLTEQECLKYFTSVKIGIEQILDEKIERQEKARKAKLAKEAIQGIHQEISASKEQKAKEST